MEHGPAGGGGGGGGGESRRIEYSELMLKRIDTFRIYALSRLFYYNFYCRFVALNKV